MSGTTRKKGGKNEGETRETDERQAAPHLLLQEKILPTTPSLILLSNGMTAA